MPRNSVIDGDDIGNQVMCGIIIINDLQILGQKKHNYTGTMSWSVEKVSEMLFGENKEVMDRALSEEVKQGEGRSSRCNSISIGLKEEVPVEKKIKKVDLLNIDCSSVPLNELMGFIDHLAHPEGLE